MKPFRFAFSTRGLVWVWMSFTAVAVLWLLALLPTDVSILAPTMSFTAFLGHAHGGGLPADGERIVGLLILGMAAGLLALYSITRSAVGRLGVALVGILSPAILLSDKVSEFGLWFVRMPLEAVAYTARALRGQGNGQFYVDGPPFQRTRAANKITEPNAGGQPLIALNVRSTVHDGLRLIRTFVGIMRVSS